jgi:tetratricopeptide (TPR) repeat protein
MLTRAAVPAFGERAKEPEASVEAPKSDSPSDTIGAAEALRGGQPVLAEQLASKVILAPNPPPKDLAAALVTRALAREQLGRPVEAVADFTRAIDLKVLSPAEMARGYFSRGVTYDGMGETADAISDYTSALKLVPQFPAALNNRGNAYRRMNQLDAAQADYNASLAAGNSSPEYPYYGLGQIAEAQGDVAGACSFYRKALEANPDYGLASKRLTELGQPWTGDNYALHPPREKLSFAPKPVKLKAPKPVDSVKSDSDSTDGKPTRPAVVSASHTKAAGVRRVQLGSFRSEQAASDAWKRLVKMAAPQLDQLTPQIIPVDLPSSGHWFRLRAGPVQSATAVCSHLKALGFACMTVSD